ncbi:MAG: pantetheine-phosphate adenylyltransferase [Candidatus Thermoplasmatota archaeon]|nr:pantetheine-phosphate adenylyltransferase [Candidatus Thermoplasmatota archaeon]
MKICIGGTFDKLHKGHKTLIKKAFTRAGDKGSVFIGITTDDFAKDKKNVKPLTERIKNIEKYLKKEGYKNKYTIQPISDKFGPSIHGDFAAIVVSSETIKTAKEINKKREKIGKKPLEIVEIKPILAEDGLRISSTRIRNNIINENGKIIR